MTRHGHAAPQPGQHRDRHGKAAVPTSAFLWRAVSDLALRWAASPVVRPFAVDLPRNADQRIEGIPGRLWEMELRGARISAQPLRLTRTIQLMQNMPPSTDSEAAPDPAKWKAWLDMAAAVEIAHGIMTAWLRSRMPGYPQLPAPQLAPGAPLTSGEWGQPYPWSRDEMRQGLQHRDPPPEITRRLGVTLPEERHITSATRTLGVALEGSVEWQRMGTAAYALTSPVRAELRQACRTVSERLSDAEVQKHRQHADERSEYRATVLKEALAALSGPAAEYARSFEAANRMLEAAASNVFGQLAIYGQPTLVPAPQDIDLTPGIHGQLVSFTRLATDSDQTPFHVEMGQLVWLDDDLVIDAIQIISSETSVSSIGERERYTGTILSGTGEAWER
jgi:hypothetical protein